MKTRTKVALLFVSLNLLIIVLFGLAIYYFLDIYSYEDFYKRLETRANIAARYNLELDTTQARVLRSIREQHLEVLQGEREYLLEVTAVVGTKELAEVHGLPLSFLDDILQRGHARYKQDNTFYAGLSRSREGRNYLVVVSAENYYASHHLSFLANLLLGGTVLVFLIIVALSFYLSKHFFDPIKNITAKVRQISTQNIHQRLDETVNNHEISELVSTSTICSPGLRQDLKHKKTSSAMRPMNWPRRSRPSSARQTSP